MESLDREQEWTVLMRAANDGDVSAYRHLLELLTPALRALARRGFARAGSGSNDIEDVVQETLLALHLKRHTWNPREPLGPWITAIARNKVIDSLRRRGRRPELPLDEAVESLHAVEPQDGLERRDLDRLLRALKGRQQAVVRAISVEGQSIRETAARLQMTEGAVRVALHRGLRALAIIYRKTEE